jgi:hypothetical protein
VRALHKLKEADGVRSEWESTPATEGEEPASVFEGMTAANADETARERREALERVKREFEKCLGGDRTSVGVFGCLCVGMSMPGEIAQRLGLEEEAVARARKRLDRQLARFAAKWERGRN